MKKKLVSLFSGCGGMDLGFEGNFKVLQKSINKYSNSAWIKEEWKHFCLLKGTSFETVFANDISPYAYSSWAPYFESRGKKEKIFHTESIIDLVNKHKSGGNIFPTNVDIVTGGFPCQDFSVAGKRKGFNSHKSHTGKGLSKYDEPSTENRGMLYYWMREVIEITKPKVFIAENVKGLISLGKVKEMIENDFRSIDKKGYIVVPSQVLNAANYGVPQNRERIIFIGLNKKYLKKEAIAAMSYSVIPEKYNPYPPITHYKDKSESLLLNFQYQNKKLCPLVKCKDAFIGLKEPDDTKDLSQMEYSKAKLFKNSQGNVEINLNTVSPTIRAEHHGNIEYRRLSKANGGRNIHELKKGLKERRLTIRECARLQTFPDDYNFVRVDKKNRKKSLSASGAYKVIGNAVPPLLAYNMAKRLEAIWKYLF